MVLYQITVYLPDALLKFKVENYKKADGRVMFIDRKTELSKDYPAEKCIIEEISK